MPKCMMKINGKFFLFFLLDLLISKGFKDIILCTGHGHKIIKKLVGDRYRSIQISYSKEENALGTGGAILHALNLFNDQKFFVLNGDSFCDFNGDLDALSNNSNNFIFIYKVSDISRYGEVKINLADNSVPRSLKKNLVLKVDSLMLVCMSLFDPFFKISKEEYSFPWRLKFFPISLGI